MKESEKKNDLLAHEWDTLRTLWKQYKLPSDDPGLREELEKALEAPLKPAEKGGWDLLNRAEQIVGVYLDQTRLKFEYDSLLALARGRNLESLDQFEKYRAAFFPDPPPTGLSKESAELLEKQQRAAYQVLLYNLQSKFVEGRFERQIKRAAAERLLEFGLVIFIMTIGLHWAWQTYAGRPVGDPLTLIIVAAMGGLGAFFSRVATFQTNFSALRFADLTNSYNRTMLFVRLIYGGIGAIILFYILRSGLLNGPMLPHWDVLEGNALGAGQPRLSLLSEWSKVLVWSFIAGFSERFISNALDKIDSR